MQHLNILDSIVKYHFSKDTNALKYYFYFEHC